ncbi:hypothetical protein [Microbacterium sp. NPDC058345]|uniref:hypothetical protein n=1 Tax=Microbacterium sp. NPDC058345 TaxID=3346455 RepID=UPI00364660B9
MSTDQASIEPDPLEPDPAGPVPAEDDAEDGVLYEEQVQPEYGILGFTLRELLIVAVWTLAFITSFFPVAPGAATVWVQGISWILSIGVPTVAVFLLVLRRFSPDGIRRVGSLGIDQFASVAFSVAAVVWAQALWNAVAATIAVGVYLVGWVTVFETVAFLGLVVLTVAAPLVPRLREDFHGRLETLAHRNANPVRPVIARPRPERGPDDTPAPAAGGTRTTPDAADALSGDARAGEGTDAPSPDADASRADRRDPDVTAVIEPVPQNLPEAETTNAADQPRVETALNVAAGESSDAAAPVDGHMTTQDLREIFAIDAPTGELPDEQSAPDATAEQISAGDHVSGGDTGTTRTADHQPAYARRNGQDAAEQGGAGADPMPGPFWILAGSERDVHDEHGRPLFRIGPRAWALVIEDRGGAYVVRHDDGRIGYLHDLTNITKG